MTVDFVTFCCPKDVRRLAVPGELTNRVNSHGYKFDNVFVVRQRLANDFDDIIISSSDFTVTEIRSEDHPDILAEYNIPEFDARAEDLTHGPSAAHYWKWHVINHLIGLKVSTADYIVFSDCDCRIINQKSPWVLKAIEIIEAHPQLVLIVGPSDGGNMAERMLPGGVRLTQNVSQQMFLCKRAVFKSIDFDHPWDGKFTAPGGPFQEYYWLMEGRIWRNLRARGMYRAILPEAWRYWHDGWH